MKEIDFTKIKERFDKEICRFYLSLLPLSECAIELNFLTDDLDLYLQKISQKIDTGEISEHSDMHEYAEQGTEMMGFIYFKYACVHYLLSKKERQLCNSDNAWALLASANHHSGVATQLFSTWRKQEGNGYSRTEIARKGGSAKGNRYQPLKDEFIRLLSQPDNHEGWPKKSDTVAILSEKLESFVYSNMHNQIRNGKIYIDVKKVATGWIYQDLKVMSVYTKFKKPPSI